MEECSVLVILEGIVNLLVPYHATICRRDVDQFDPEGVPDKIVGEDDSALQAGVGPSFTVGMGNIETSNSNRLNFVCRLRDGALDGLLVSFGEDGRHGRDIALGTEIWALKRGVRSAVRGIGRMIAPFSADQKDGEVKMGRPGDMRPSVRSCTLCER